MEKCPPVTRQEIEAGLNAQFDAWFGRLQSLTSRALDPEEWTGRWFDGWTPEEALAEGPEPEQMK